MAWLGLGCQQQVVPERLQTSYAPLNEKLASMVTADAVAISPQEAKQLQKPIFLDARELEEYQVSHLPQAWHIGYDQPQLEQLAGLDKESPLVVYCTIGYRSERMAQKLRKLGFKQVYNLYGSIYAWAMAGYPLERAGGESTQKIHTYNKKWGTYYPIEAHKVY